MSVFLKIEDELEATEKAAEQERLTHACHGVRVTPWALMHAMGLGLHPWPSCCHGVRVRVRACHGVRVTSWALMHAMGLGLGLGHAMG